MAEASIDESSQSKKLNVLYILIQMLFNAAYCGIAGYASAYLLGVGFTNTDIGTITTVSTIIGLIIQPFVGDLVDNNPHVTEKKINIFVYLASAVCALGVFALKVKMLVAILFVVMTCLITCEIALATSLAFAHIERGAKINFSLARGFGSLGYSIASFGLGRAAAAAGTDIVMPITIAICILACLCVLPFPEIKGVKKNSGEAADAATEESNESLGEFCKKNPRYIGFAICVLLIFFSHMIHATYWFQFITNIGGTVDEFGTMAAVCALLEFPAMAIVPSLMRKFKLMPLMIVAGVFFAIKLLFIGLAPNIPIMYIGTICQMFSFALFTPVSSYYANAVTTAAENNKAQSILNLGREGGTIFAAMIGGIMIDMGGYTTLTILGAVVTLIGTILMAFIAPKVPEGKEYRDSAEAKGVSKATAEA
jgi:PPP family 3-phenylpropionic acid transporter